MDRKHIFFLMHIIGILLDFGEELFASNMFALGHFHPQAGKQEQQDGGREVKGGNSYYVRIMRSVISALTGSKALTVCYL